VVVLDTFPSDATSITPGSGSCPAGTPAGTVCYSVGDLDGGKCKLWPNGTALATCPDPLSNGDPNASTDFASNTFLSGTNGAKNSASVQSTEVSTAAVQATCPSNTSLPAINVSKSCTATINSSLAVGVSYNGSVCNESNLTLTVNDQPTDVQVVPQGQTGASDTAAYTGQTTPFTLAACTATVSGSPANPTPCTSTMTCSDNGVVCAVDNDCATGYTCGSTPGGTGKVCLSCVATAAGVCAPYTGSYTPPIASSGSNGGNICFKDTVTAKASSGLLGKDTTNTSTASCTLCPGGTCTQ